MARALSSMKRMRQNAKRAARNKAAKTTLKSHVGRVLEAIGKHAVEAGEEALRQTIKVLDRSANRGTIHPKTAARRKSRLTKRLNAIKTAPKKK